MKLSKLERLILFNQHSILEKINKANSDHHRHMKKVYENGYAIHYNDDFDHIYDELSENRSTFVIDVLDMYSAMQRSLRQIDDTDDLSKDSVRFIGFDGNNETSLMAYAMFFVEELGRFSDLDIHDFNSHMHTVDRYQRMLAEWKSRETSDRYQLSKQGIKDILEAG
jgi:uncharacterized protein YfbU (UPF0304 family)